MATCSLLLEVPGYKTKYRTKASIFNPGKRIGEATLSSTYCAVSTSASGLVLNCSRQHIKT